MMKKICTLLLLSISPLTLTGCGGISVPDDKQDYIGQWNSESATLHVYPQRIEYETHGTMSSSISAPITKFENEDFYAGIWKFAQKFDVTIPPYEENGNWYMEMNSRKFIKARDIADEIADIDIDEAKKMVKIELEQVETWLETGNINPMYSNASKLFQAQITKKEFIEMMSGVSDNKEYFFPSLKNGEIVITGGPGMRERTWLFIQGYSLYKKDILEFKFEYIKEDNEWKMGDINLYMKGASVDAALQQSKSEEEL